MTRHARFGYFLPLCAVLLMGATLGWAKDSRTLKLNYPVTLNGTELPAGTYKMTVSDGPEATVTLAKSKDVVATLEGKWVDRENRYAQGSVVYESNADGSRSLAEVRFAGSNKVLVFEHGSTSAGM